MQKTYSPEQILQTKDFDALSAENARIFLLSLIQHLEDQWDKKQLRSQLLNILINILQSSKLPRTLKDTDLKQFLSALVAGISIKEFLSFAVPLERKLGGHPNEYLYTVESKDGKLKNCEETRTSPLYVIADNLRSAFNVGSIFRTSECLGAEHIFLCGYTADPEKPRTKKSAMGTEDLISWSWQAKASNAIKTLQEKNIPCIALETASPSTSILEFEFPKSCALLLGNERYGIDPVLLDLCDHIVHIPVYGNKNSLNVGVAFAIAAYEYKRQHQH